MLAEAPHEFNAQQKRFLSRFEHTLFCYIHDSRDDMPVIHSEIIDLAKQDSGYGIFFTVNGFTGGKRTQETLTNINGFFCDIDYPDKKNQTPESLRMYKQDILTDLIDDELPIPTYIVETKNGFHVYWLLEQPIYLNNLNETQRNEMLLQYRDIEEAILKRFDGDPGAKDASRVLRVPGTLHQKDPKEPFKVKVVHEARGDECIYTFDWMREKFLKRESADTWAVANAENPLTDEAIKKVEIEYPKLERDSYKKLFAKKPGSVPEGMRNKALLIAANAAREAGWTFEQTCEHFYGFEKLGVREVRKTIRSAFDHKYDFGYNNEVMQALVTQDERVKLSMVTSKVLSKHTREQRAATNNQQKELYNTYEFVLANRFPFLKYKERGDFYDYYDGVYHPVQTEEVRSKVFREMLKDGLVNYRTVSRANDKIATFKSLDGRTFTEEDENPDENILNFKNGLLNIEDYVMRQHTPDYISTSQIPIVYNQEATCPRWETFIDEITNGDKQQGLLLQQIAGYCLTTDTRYAKAFILFGAGANGKSMYTRMLAKIIGRDSVSSLNLSTITKQFGLTGLIGKKMNIIDEISGNYFESNVIKGLISGERMAAEVKYRPEPIEFVSTAKLLFSVNELPKINDTTMGLYRRFIIVPFERTFVANPDVDLEEKLTLELTGIVNWAIDGLKKLRSMGRFAESEKNHDVMRAFKVDNSPVVEFMHYYYQPVDKADRLKYKIGMGDIYAQYRGFCVDHGYRPKSMANFSRELQHNFIDGFDIEVLTHEGRKSVLGIRRSKNNLGDDIVYPDQRHAL